MGHRPDTQKMELLDSEGMMAMDVRQDDTVLYSTETTKCMFHPTREEWKRGLKSQHEDCLIWYTDGSKTKSSTGAGTYSKDCSVS